MRKQEPHETLDAFVTALYALVEHCNYGTLHDELIRDRIVVGLADTRLSECMQIENDLDLQKAMNMARQSEEIKKQQTTLISENSVMQTSASSVDRVVKSKQQYDKTKFTDNNKTTKVHQQFATKGKNPSNARCYRFGLD